MADPAGSLLFAAFLDKNDLTLTAAAKALDVKVPTVHEWKTGNKRPRHEYRVAIETWTHGEVPADAWRSEEEIAIASRTVPFVPPSGPALRTEAEEPAATGTTDPHA